MDLNKSSSNILKMYCGLDINKRKNKYYASLVYIRMRIAMNYCFYIIPSRNVVLLPLFLVKPLLTLIVHQTSDIYWLLPFQDACDFYTLPSSAFQLWHNCVCVWWNNGVNKKKKISESKEFPIRLSHICYDCHSPSSQGGFSALLLYFRI